MTRDEKRLLGFNASAHGLVHLLEGVLPPLIPLLMVRFGTDYIHMGLVVTVFSYAFGLGALPAGYISDRVEPRRLILIFLFGSGLLAMAIMPVESLFGYGVLMGGIGLFCSTYHPAGNTLIAHVFKKKGNAFAINGIVGSLGVAVVPLVSAWIGTSFGWKAPHVVFGVFGIMVGCYGLRVSSHIPPPIGEMEPEDSGEDEPKKLPLFKLIIFYCSAVNLGIIYKGVMTFLPAYMGEKVQVDFVDLNTVAIGGTVATLALSAGAAGQYIAGRLSDRTKPERIYFAGTLLGTFCVFAMAITTNLLLVLFSMLFAFFYFSTQPTQNYIISTYLPRHRRGIGFGIHFFLAFGVGSTAAAAAGYVADSYGLVSVFYAMGGSFLIASLFTGILMLKAEASDST